MAPICIKPVTVIGTEKDAPGHIEADPAVVIGASIASNIAGKRTKKNNRVRFIDKSYKDQYNIVISLLADIPFGARIQSTFINCKDTIFGGVSNPFPVGD